jgi:hypothetical protein
MVTGRIHRMTEVFARLAPGATLDQARAELKSVYATIKKDHPEAYPAQGDYRIDAKMFRDQITFGARTILLVLLGAAGLVFIIACSNVANLILARTVRREGELAVRAALGASKGALRRMLLAESVLLCGIGAMIGVASAQPMVAVLARYASRFSVRALDLKVDSSLLWVGAGLALVAAAVLAFVPRLPSADAAKGLNLSSGSVRIIGSTSRRQRIFAVTQIAASFVLLAGASTVITTLIELQRIQTGLDTRHVLAIDVPPMTYGKTPQQVVVLQGIDAAHRCIARREQDRVWDGSPMARGQRLRVTVFCRRAYPYSRRRSARPVPRHLSRILRRAGSSHHCRARLQ